MTDIGGTASLLLYPIEFFRTRLAMDTGVQNRLYPRGTRDVLVSIYQVDGIRGFFQVRNVQQCLLCIDQ